MTDRIIWKLNNKKKQCTEVRNIKVSSDNLKNNQLVCALIENGWVVLKLEIRHKNQKGYYAYMLGKPLAQ